MDGFKKIESITTTTYEIIDGFRVDIINEADKEMYYAYLYHENYGIKDMLIGCPYYQTPDVNRENFLTEEAFTKMIFSNLFRGCEYIHSYVEEYM